MTNKENICTVSGVHWKGVQQGVKPMVKTSTIFRKILGWKIGDKCAINYPTYGVKAYGTIVELIQEDVGYAFILNEVKYYHVAVVKIISYPWKPVPERIIVPVRWLEEV